VITAIQKEYAGQGQKVMNAMWGAGQMMFNKILVLSDEAVPVQQYEELARYVFDNVNPATDIYFSQGPMDVLDHSCSKLGFGGKMCIDGTKKTPEEADDRFAGNLPLPTGEVVEKTIKTNFPEVQAVNVSLLKKQIPCIIVSVEKNRKAHIAELQQQLCNRPELEGIKMILYVEHTVNANDLPTALWRFCNNLDPKRDQFLVQRMSWQQPGKLLACLGLDGTRKTKELDDFQRDWPNIIVADDATIRSVDEKWAQLDIGPLIPSPSLKFKDQLYGEEAAVK
jgi:4-hydroxy-3-polyprenylbenzoate decarboxylase